MKFISYKLMLLTFLFIWQPLVYCEQIKIVQEHVVQLKLLLTQIQQNALDTNQNKVYLGTEQIAIQRFNETLSFYTRQLIQLLNSLEKNSPQNVVAELQWLPATNGILPKIPLVNAGLPEQVLTICQASFLGPRNQGKALYPGELTPNGCRISYAGYAFTVNKYNVLAGANTGLHWITINDVKSNMKAAFNSNAAVLNPPSFRRLLTPIFSFNYNITINGAKPIAGGYQSDAPVLICRAKQKETFVIGKLVFFRGKMNQFEDACDIGVNDKEVVIQKDYELLFWQAPNHV